MREVDSEKGRRDPRRKGTERVRGDEEVEGRFRLKTRGGRGGDET